MRYDEYWNKFITDGKIDSYLRYKEHLNTQGSNADGTSTDNDRRSDNKGAEYR